ncbi:NB-ARC and TPR domain protein [Penicillium concentricum]|uniref:NB-ARC and TPR domain protein n=1 Tax=Penicillium concentricum TaxID=293559 RepID=A0A9W9VJ96_9EURO|nr:NB-ARC and TPR domain protein [Penicillium concentricum]KAJ5382884.1 NB-ARC and TPR domain protein [Penicillium concentricum]
MDKDTSQNEATTASSTSTIFESLDATSRCLLKALLFPNPDSISLALFEASDRGNYSPELPFCLTFIQKQTDSYTFTIDKVIHNELKNLLSENDRQCSFKNATFILHDVWKNDWLENPWLISEWETAIDMSPTS